MSKVLNRRQLAKIRKSLGSWMKTRTGERFLREQQEAIQSLLPTLFGYEMLQMSAFANVDFSASSKISHQFFIDPLASHGGNSAQAHYDSLPLADESIDLVLLHHVLDFSDNPHQVLREVDRVLVPHGVVILTGFNPISLLGSWRWLCRRFSRQSIRPIQSLTAHRIKDWLRFLDLRLESEQYGCFFFGLKDGTKIKGLDCYLSRMKLPFGGYYLMQIRKERVGVTPLKPRWGQVISPISEVVARPVVGMSENNTSIQKGRKLETC